MQDQSMAYLQDEATRNAYIKNISLIVVKSNPMYRREQVVSSTQGAVNRMQDSYDQYGHAAFSNEMLVNTAPGLMKYSDAPMQEVTVPYGWDTERLGFDITVETRDGNSVYKTVIKGFTDKFDISLQNTLNPDTMFYVDNVINTACVIDPLTGAIGNERIVSAYTVMTNPMTGEENLTYDSSYLEQVAIRPEDIIMGIAASQVSDINTTVLNTITTSATEAKSKDLNPLNNISEVLSSSAKQSNDIEFNQDPSNAMLNTLAYSVEYRVDDQPFFKRMATVVHSSRVGQFNYAELSTAFGNVDNVTVLTRPEMGGFTMDGNSSGVTSPLASMSNVFLDASLSYIRKYSIVDISFTVTNKTVDGSTSILLLSAPGSDIQLPNLMSMANRALEEIQNFAFPMITHGKFGVSITAHITRSDALIEIEFEGRQAEPFSFSLLAYSLASPVIGTRGESQAIIQQVAGLTDLIIHTGDNYGNQQIIY